MCDCAQDSTQDRRTSANWQHWAIHPTRRIRGNKPEVGGGCWLEWKIEGRVKGHAEKYRRWDEALKRTFQQANSTSLVYIVDKCVVAAGGYSLQCAVEVLHLRVCVAAYISAWCPRIAFVMPLPVQTRTTKVCCNRLLDYVGQFCTRC